MSWSKKVLGFLTARRKVLGLFVVIPLVVVVAGIGIARLVGKGDLTRQIAVYAAVVVTLNLFAGIFKNVYDVWVKEQEREKQQADKRERVKATADYQPVGGAFTWEPVIGVELYNEGSTTVALRRVTLVVSTPGGNLTEELVSPGPQARDVAPAGVPLIPTYASRLNLEPKQHVRFHQRGIANRLSSGMLQSIAPETFWIVVESFTEELTRIPGSDIQAAIRANSVKIRN